MGKAAKIFGTLLVGGGLTFAGLRVYQDYDPKGYRNLMNSVHERINQLTTTAPVKSTRQTPTPVESKPSPPPTTAQSSVNKKENNNEKIKAMEEKLKDAFKKDMEKLKEETEWLADNYSRQLRVAQLNGLRQLDQVASAFQLELSKARENEEKLRQKHEEELKSIMEEFDRMVDVKVDEQTRMRLGQLHLLAAQVEKLRSSTKDFTQFASLHLYTLHLVRLLNTLPHGDPSGHSDLMVLSDPFVKTVLDQMPREVESPESLNASYATLKPRLKQLSLVPKDGGLFSLILSRLLSPFLFSYQTRIEAVDTLLNEGNLFDALDELVELNNEGWNSLVLDDFVDRVRKRAEFELGLGALTAHLGLISTCSVLPQIQHSNLVVKPAKTTNK